MLQAASVASKLRPALLSHQPQLLKQPRNGSARPAAPPGCSGPSSVPSSGLPTRPPGLVSASAWRPGPAQGPAHPAADSGKRSPLRSLQQGRTDQLPAEWEITQASSVGGGAHSSPLAQQLDGQLTHQPHRDSGWWSATGVATRGRPRKDPAGRLPPPPLSPASMAGHEARSPAMPGWSTGPFTEPDIR